MRHPIRATTLGAALIALAAACSDSTGGGGGTPPDQLTYLRLPPTAPPLCADSTGGWAVKDPNGQDFEIALVFPESGNLADCTGGSTEDFLRLKIEKLALLRYPNGNLVSNGDSVFISVKWVGADSILFDLEPSGLTFDPAKPADLKIEYDELNDDLDGDGDTDAEDADIEQQIDIWRQAKPGDPFVKVGTGKIEDQNEIEAKLLGFSRYAIAY
ncbi:MAG: hypothetical protein JNM53_09225 [Gemmatimonadetes bacterium]|nr:hypothetical protein [Gemmatimonadota bacterium]